MVLKRVIAVNMAKVIFTHPHIKLDEMTRLFYEKRTGSTNMCRISSFYISSVKSLIDAPFSKNPSVYSNLFASLSNWAFATLIDPLGQLSNASCISS